MDEQSVEVYQTLRAGSWWQVKGFAENSLLKEIGHLC